MGEVWLAEDPTGASGGAPRGSRSSCSIPTGSTTPRPAPASPVRCEAARRVTGPTIAALLDADVDAPQPWLASAYVAGPTLADHVAGPRRPGRQRPAGARVGAGRGPRRHPRRRRGPPGPDAAQRRARPRRAPGRRLRHRLVRRGRRDHRDRGPRRHAGVDGARAPDPRRGHRAGDVWSWGAVMAYAALGLPRRRRQRSRGGGAPHHAAARSTWRAVPAWLAPWVAAAMSVAPGERPTPAALVAAIPGAVPACRPRPPGLAPTAPIPPTGGLPPDGTGAAAHRASGRRPPPCGRRRHRHRARRPRRGRGRPARRAASAGAWRRRSSSGRWRSWWCWARPWPWACGRACWWW